MIRHRGVMVEELSTDAEAYEEGFRSAVEAQGYWREANGIEIESVSLDGSYPETRLAVVFRPVPDQRHGERRFDCRFGYRVRIWPAESIRPEQQADAWSVYSRSSSGLTVGRTRSGTGRATPKK